MQNIQDRYRKYTFSIYQSVLDLAVLSKDDKSHPYICNYAVWLLKKMDNTYD